VCEVDAALVGETVTLRFDPAAPPQRPLQVCHRGKFIAQAKPVETYANCFVKRNRPARTLEVDDPAPEPPAAGLMLRALPDQNEEEARRCTVSILP
jgi:putative transposase